MSKREHFDVECKAGLTGGTWITVTSSKYGSLEDYTLWTSPLILRWTAKKFARKLRTQSRLSVEGIDV